MYVCGQWLWDRYLKQPVQYMGVEIRIKGPSIWHVKEDGKEKAYEFNGFKWWNDRYIHMLDGRDTTKILGAGAPVSSQFYGGPFSDCIEIILKPQSPIALTDSPDKCLQAIIEHNDRAVELLNESTARASLLAAENKQLKQDNTKLTELINHLKRRLNGLSSRISRTKRMLRKL